MPVWTEILISVLLIGFILFFAVIFTYESRKQSKRIKLWKEILRLIERYNNNKTDELKNQIKIMWEEYKNIWDKFRFKEITRDKIEKTEKFLISERIIKT